MNDLPSDWARTTVGAVASIHRGVTYRKGDASARPASGLVPLLRATNISEQLSLDDCVYVPEGLVSEQQLLREGDIVMAASSGSASVVGKSAQLSRPWRGSFGAFCACIRPGPNVSPRYLAWFLASDGFRRRASRLAAGSNINNLKREHISETPVPLPPRDEQDRIVKAIETQEARIGDGGQSLAEAYKLATVLSQAILDAAARADGTIRPLEDCLLEPLMNGRSVRTAQEGFPVLRLTALKHGRIDVSEAKVGAWTELEASPYLISAGDFLVARGNGSLNLVGRGGLVEGNLPPVAFPDTLIRVRVDPDVLRPDFLRLVWDSRDIRAQIETQARTTAGIYKINQGHVRAIQLPVPGLDEQDRIVSRAQRQVAALDQLLTALDRQRRAVTQLRRSLLRRAFSGALVAQDHADESAFELLRRVRDDHGATDPQLKAAAS